jgi:hypothetical protein
MKKQNQEQCEAPKWYGAPTPERIRLEEVAGKWWYCEVLGIYAHNGYLATCECSTGWVLVPNAVKEADEARKLKEMEDKYNIKEDEYGGVF